MKLLILMIFSFMFISSPEHEAGLSTTDDMTYAEQVVVFRSTQHLISRDGREIYLYPSRKCELFDNGKLIVTCTYRLQDGEVRLLDENNDTVYKGTYRLASDRRNIVSLTLAGTVFNRKY